MAGSALREILAEYGFAIDTSNIEAADSLVDGMGDKLLSFGKWVAAAFAVRAVIGFTKGLIDTADHLNDTSQRLNVSTDDLQAWQYAAKLNGVEADELNASFQRLQAGIAGSADEAGNAKAYKKLGVELKNADGTLKSTSQVFEEAGLAIGALQDPTEQAGYAAKLFGKSYARLLPLFRQGPEGIAKLKKEFQELGGGLSSDFIQNAADFNDQIDTLGIAGRGLASQVLAPLLPLLVELAKDAVSFGKAVAGTNKGNDTLTLVGRALGNIVRVFTKGGVATSAFSAGLRVAGRFARILVEPLLDLEDFLVFLAGGDSVLGDWVDANFGAGTTGKIQQWFADFATGLDKTEYSLKELGLGMIALGLQTSSVAAAIKAALLSVPADVGAAFEKMWNEIIDGASDAVVRLGRFVKHLPGRADEGSGIEAAGLGLKGSKSFTAQGAAAQAQADAILEQAKIANLARSASEVLGPGGKPGDNPGAAAQAQANALLALAQATVAQQQAHGPGGTTAATAQPSGPPQILIDGMKLESKTYVTVPAGTDADVAKGVGDASNKGAVKGMQDLTATVAAATSG